MRNIKWLAFGASNSVACTIVHFFPSGGGVTAPYPSNCTVTIFGGLSGSADAQNTGGIVKKVVLEGARLSQPDGVRLEQAFPELADGINGFFGLTVELSTSQPRIDLSASECIIELRSRSNSIRFWPKLIEDSEDSKSEEDLMTPAGMACLEDSFLSSSLLIVNESAEPLNPECFICDYTEGKIVQNGEDDNKPLRLMIETGEVPPQSVMELPFTDSILSNTIPQECSWGMLNSAAVYSGAEQTGLGMYALYRDVVTKRPVSVSAL